ncbi:GntR family transcriptional regulator [Nocardia sp. alder85J]|uniref:GntR family transcriptional regulator n=1 Tax=Nocardia sp. alder85J TaxID=2862949 RepID=UPI00224E5D96|nr:FCD domain-containing protein [Nocardia sp. alder85J]MCX4090861.1 FCD domain-containing protein [Nocardia sp. alder85J]
MYETVRHRLTAGEYGPGTALVPATLSAEFRVSRTPVREALGLLEREGLLVGTARGFVPRIRTEEEALEIFEARAILESGAAAAAAERRTHADLLRLQEISERAREQTDPAEVRRYLNAWHDAVRRAAHNDTLGALLHTLEAQAKLAAPWRSGDHGRPLAERRDEHDAVLAAITDRDADRARRAMLEHLARDRDFRIRHAAR